MVSLVSYPLKGGKMVTPVDPEDGWSWREIRHVGHGAYRKKESFWGCTYTTYIYIYNMYIWNIYIYICIYIYMIMFGWCYPQWNPKTGGYPISSRDAMVIYVYQCISFIGKRISMNNNLYGEACTFCWNSQVAEIPSRWWFKAAVFWQIHQITDVFSNQMPTKIKHSDIAT